MGKLLAIHPQLELLGDQSFIFWSGILPFMEEHFDGTRHVIRVPTRYWTLSHEMSAPLNLPRLREKFSPQIFAIVELDDNIIRHLLFPTLDSMWVTFEQPIIRRVNSDFFDSVKPVLATASVKQ